MINFDIESYYLKLNKELSRINSFKIKFWYYSIKTISHFCTFLVLAVISIFIILILQYFSILNFSDNLSMYFSLLIAVVLLVAGVFEKYIQNNLFSGFVKLFNNGIELQDINDQKYILIMVIKKLERTKSFIETNKKYFYKVDLDSKNTIEKILSNYFENEYLNDPFILIFNESIKKIREILIDQHRKFKSILPAIIPIVQESTTPKIELDKISIPAASTFNEVFFDNSIVHKIYNANEIFELCSEVLISNDVKSSNVNFTRKKDFIKEYLSNLDIGLLGELFVFHFEQKRLLNCNQENYVEHIKHVSLKFGDIYGYDILSFEKDGNEMYIEVKTTSGNIDAGFYLTKNEFEKLTHNDNYYIYRVFNFDCVKFEGMIYKINSTSLSNHFVKTPKEYKVSVI